MWLRNKFENCAIGWNFKNNIIEIVAFKIEEIKLGSKEKLFFQHDKFWNHLDRKFEIVI